ncbi:hypothetical protein [Tenacibaculum xiamenense]|uniref:hypothetical protein n=1 Tax=Tenacibaculum xiamenense TaxID=1261553 RepID=UPI003895CBB1
MLLKGKFNKSLAILSSKEIYSLKTKIEELTQALFELVEETCWNKLSKNMFYFISEIIPFDEEQKNIDTKPTPLKSVTLKSLDEIADDLFVLYPNLYDVNFYVYQSFYDKTIIQIKYFPKSSITKNTFRNLETTPPMFHCKISLPVYAKERNKKFDINWEHGGFRHEWNLFWYKLYFNWKYRNRIKNVS